MASAWQSAEMPMKNHKQPGTGIIGKLVYFAGRILKLERHGGLINKIHFHS
jgi:hypothetical protein